MSYKLIMLSSPILINDQNDEYKEYDWNNLNYSDFDGNSSVIVSGFGLPQLPRLDLSKLTTDECISIGWIDNGWIEETSNLLNDEIIKKVSRLCLTSGHSKTRVMNKDKFLLDFEDMRKIILMSRIRNYNTTPRYSFDEIISSCCKPKIFDVEVEFEDDKCVITKLI
jgi:hypothetical protein